MARLRVIPSKYFIRFETPAEIAIVADQVIARSQKDPRSHPGRALSSPVAYLCQTRRVREVMAQVGACKRVDGRRPQENPNDLHDANGARSGGDDRCRSRRRADLS